jgi:hypothetical protein
MRTSVYRRSNDCPEALWYWSLVWNILIFGVILTCAKATIAMCHALAPAVSECTRLLRVLPHLI